jgi:hypothetical protein
VCGTDWAKPPKLIVEDHETLWVSPNAAGYATSKLDIIVPDDAPDVDPVDFGLER